MATTQSQIIQLQNEIISRQQKIVELLQGAKSSPTTSSQTSTSLTPGDFCNKYGRKHKDVQHELLDRYRKNLTVNGSINCIWYYIHVGYNNVAFTSHEYCVNQNRLDELKLTQMEKDAYAVDGLSVWFEKKNIKS